MNINEFLDKTMPDPIDTGFSVLQSGPRPRVVCADGFTISVQAGDGVYCQPRKNFLTHYTEVELGYPNEKWTTEDDTMFKEWQEDTESTSTVWGYVPVHLVDKLIENHGGFVVYEWSTYRKLNCNPIIW